PCSHRHSCFKKFQPLLVGENDKNLEETSSETMAEVLEPKNYINSDPKSVAIGTSDLINSRVCDGDR
ncbi:unnamed protein product, partial [Prunus brigantina]